ncbi:MAG: ABC transporter ATP-binding protein [Clostridiales bacterium]|jgi:NitT/TauT family transport system ATP-binding protein|nr:ABC transporter ATP-binding protein [Clostridiales bacterium]
MIVFESVCKSFGATVVFDGLNDAFEKGKVSCLLAPSGSGKTTLLNMVAGTLKPDGGTIKNLPEAVSYVFQEERLIPQKTAYKNLEFVLKPKYPDAKKLGAIIASHLEAAGLKDAADMYPNEMSGGMRQRLSLIRALANPAETLLMDEPFNALDMTLRAGITDMFLKYLATYKKTVLFVTHDLDEAISAGDNIHIYTSKPMRLIIKLEIPGTKGERKLYDGAMTKFKKEIYRLTAEK